MTVLTYEERLEDPYRDAGRHGGHHGHRGHHRGGHNRIRNNWTHDGRSPRHYGSSTPVDIHVDLIGSYEIDNLQSYLSM